MPLFQRVRSKSAPQSPEVNTQDQRKRYIPGSSLWARFRPVTAALSQLIHKALGDRAPVTRLVDRTIRVVSDLSSSQKARLQDWVASATCPKDKDNRTKAADAILECARKSATGLSLASLELDSLPDVLGEMRQLKVLLLGGNKLDTLPDTLSGLRNLQYLTCEFCGLKELPSWLSLSTNLHYLNANGNQLNQLPASFAQLKKLETLKLVKNQFTSLPSSLLQLGGSHTCKVFLAKNNFPESKTPAFHDVRGAGKLLVYTTPRTTLKDADAADLGELINHWFWAAEKDCPSGVHSAIAKLDGTAKETLKIHLSKLIKTQDYEHPLRGLAMAHRVSTVLEIMAEDECVMEDCLAASFEATSSCTDRALLGLNMMEQAAKIAKTRRLDDPAELVILGSGLWRMGLVKEIAAKEYKKQQGLKQLVTLHEGDQVEIELAYLLGLKEKLDLPLAENQHMRNRNYSEVTERMLEAAEKKITGDIKKNPGEEYKYLAQWPPLNEKLLDLYYGDIDQIGEEYLDQIDALDMNDGDYSIEIARLQREREVAVENFLVDAIKAIKARQPLPYSRKTDVIKRQQTELARLKTDDNSGG